MAGGRVNGISAINGTAIPFFHFVDRNRAESTRTELINFLHSCRSASALSMFFRGGLPSGAGLAPANIHCPSGTFRETSHARQKVNGGSSSNEVTHAIAATRGTRSCEYRFPCVPEGQWKLAGANPASSG